MPSLTIESAVPRKRPCCYVTESTIIIIAKLMTSNGSSVTRPRGATATVTHGSAAAMEPINYRRTPLTVEREALRTGRGQKFSSISSIISNRTTNSLCSDTFGSLRSVTRSPVPLKQV